MSKAASGRIEIRNLSKTYMMDGSRIDALKGVNLDIVRGDSLAILGVSGAGKSTLLHILGTLDHPTEGSFLYDGMSIFEWNEESWRTSATARWASSFSSTTCCRSLRASRTP